MTLKAQPLQPYFDLPSLPTDGTVGPDAGRWEAVRRRAAVGLKLQHIPAQ